MKRRTETFLAVTLLMMGFILLFLAIGFTVKANAADVGNDAGEVTVKKSGKYYFGYGENGELLSNRWGKVKGGDQTVLYYFDKKGRAYTGVKAIGKTVMNTKLYCFDARGRLVSDKTSKLQKLSGSGKKIAALKQYITSIDREIRCKSATACGVKMLIFSNGFTVYMDPDHTNLVGYVLTDQV